MLLGSKIIRFAAIAVASTFLLALIGCRSHTAPGRPRVVVSTFPVFDLVRRIADGDADVALAKPGSASPVAGEPSGVQLAVSVGLGFDPWMKSINAKRSLQVGDRVPTLPSPDGRGIDPYVWLDPQRARLIAKVIAEDLSRVDSAHARQYRARAAELDRAIEALDKEVEAKAKSWQGEVKVDRSQLAYFIERYRIAVAPAEAGGHQAVIDPIGGDGVSDTYESVVRRVVSAIDSSREKG